MKFNPKLIFIPLLLALACSAILAYVNHRTAPVIAAAGRKKETLSARRALPPELPPPVKTNLNAVACFASFDARGKLLGVAVEGVSKNGYGGEIRVMAGFTADGRLHDFQVLSAPGETPGLGTKIQSDAFRLPLRGRPATAGWTLKKDGGDIDAVTAATISSRAVLEALRDAAGKWERITLKQGMITNR